MLQGMFYLHKFFRYQRIQPYKYSDKNRGCSCKWHSHHKREKKRCIRQHLKKKIPEMLMTTVQGKAHSFQSDGKQNRENQRVTLLYTFEKITVRILCINCFLSTSTESCFDAVLSAALSKHANQNSFALMTFMVTVIVSK